MNTTISLPTEVINALDAPTQKIRAAILIIGDEVLAGEVKESNTAFLLTELSKLGIQTHEVRWVRDDESAIVNAVNALRSSYDYLFTTGGIGPTHDDITAAAIAKAFAVPLEHHPEARQMLERYANSRGIPCTEAMLQMALFPVGATLIVSPEISAPGFCMDNVLVLAGVPAIMRQMFCACVPRLRRGPQMISFAFKLWSVESLVAVMLAELAQTHPAVSVGSYPYSENGQWLIRVVCRSFDPVALAMVRTAAQERLHREGYVFEML